MKRFLIFILTFVAVSVYASDPIYYVQNQKGLDYKFIGKKDEHRFGVQLKENEQFHHTITAEDGVRLGCYGYTLDGRKYSTHYVADGKGYRLVPHNAVITVYPKDGGEPRMASFVGAFSETNIKTKNIQYFFPEGCAAPRIEVTPLESDSGKGKLTDAQKQSEQDRLNMLKKQQSLKGDTNGLNKNADKNLNNQKNKNSLSGTSDTCCNLSKTQIIFPSSSSSSQTCGKDVAQIIIPIESSTLMKVPMKEIYDITTEVSVTKMLEKLVSLAQKYKL